MIHVSRGGVMSIARGSLNWPNIIFLLASPMLAILAAGFCVRDQGLLLGDVLCFLSMICLTGISITGGYHRYYSHRSYQCHPVLQAFFILFGAAALQAPVLNWVSEHRNHHRFVDQDKDPYNISKGFFWAHVGWTFCKDVPNFDNIPDLANNRLLLLQQRYHVPLGFVVGFGVPLLMGAAYGSPWGGLVWGGLVRVVVGHHFTFFVNSIGHRFGRQPYSDRNSSRDSELLALLTLGEGYHNFHHTFPGDYRNGVRWYHWDPTKWWIFALSVVGLTSRLNRTPSERVQRRQLGAKAGVMMPAQQR
jgi:stearoyl-CoA desaturase (delta-9 desaturase)